jgi:hypothetical protein
LKAPEACQFTQPGFTCNQKPHSIVADASNNVRLIFQLDNAQGKSIEVKGVLCTTAPPGNILKDDITVEYNPTKKMTSGQSIVFGSSGQEVPCIGEDGTSRVQLSPSSNFRGTLAVKYRFVDDLGPDRLAVATVTGSVQGE